MAVTSTGVLVRVTMRSVIDPGAQTKRRDDAGPVSAWLRGEDSPAALLPCLCL